MDIRERISQIEEAIHKVDLARRLVQKAIKGTGLEPHYQAYGEYGFRQLLNEGNPYDRGLENLIKRLNEEE